MTKRGVRVGVMSIALLPFWGCHAKPNVTPSPKPSAGETGIASWYGHPFDGRLTASGEVFHMEQPTAAHRTYPFGTVLRVTDEDSGKSIDVRVNDRGPFVSGRIIDLSHGAAQAIAMPSIAKVMLEVLSVPKTRGLQSYAVQVGSFADRGNAVEVMTQMQRRFGDARIIFRDEDGTWRVLVGSAPTIEAATRMQEQLGQGTATSFVVMIDATP